MANFIPWGSKNTKEFLTKLGAAHPELLKRALGFADDLNVDIINAIRPKLPFRFFVATYRRGAMAVPIVYVRHPASLRISRDAARRLVDRVPKMLAGFC